MSKIDAQTVQMAYLTSDDQIATLEGMLAQNVSNQVFRRAARELNDRNPAMAGLMVAWVEERFGGLVEKRGRGRPAPSPGTVAEYSAQQVGNNRPFCQVPLHTLGLSKGEEVVVEFRDNEIVLRAAN